MTDDRGPLAADSDALAAVDARLLARRLEAWAGDGTLACWIEDDARTYALALALARRLMVVEPAPDALGTEREA